MQFYNNTFLAGARIAAFTAVFLLLATIGAQAQMGGEEGIRIRERVMRFKMARLIEVLDMDEATAEKFFVRYNLSQKVVKNAQQSLDSTINELEKAVHDNNRARIRELSDLSVKKHAEFQDAIAEVFRSVRHVLSEDQYAKFLIFEARFQEEVKRLIMERREKMGDDDSPRKNKRRRDNGD